MAANGETGSIVNVISRILKAHVDALDYEQKQVFIQSVVTELSSPMSSSPAESVVMTPATPPQDRAANRRKLKQVQARRAQRKKGVNAFMVFRSYYSSLLVGLPQKTRSPMLSCMWRAEKRQSLFSLLGAAYSRIRDEEFAPKVTLDDFLRVAAKVVPIIPPNEYLLKCGWTIIGQDLYAITAVDTVAVEAEYPLQTNLSPQNLISYCIQQGLISWPLAVKASSTGDTTHRSIIAFAAIPQGDITASPENNDTPNISDFEFNSAPPTPEDTWPLTEADLFDTPSPQVHRRISISTINTEQQHILEQVPEALHWSPLIEPPFLNFNPSIIQDDFDPFTFINMDGNCAQHQQN